MCPCRSDWELFERLRLENKDLKRRLKEKHNKVSQMEGLMLEVSRTLEVCPSPPLCECVCGVWCCLGYCRDCLGWASL